MVDNGIKNGIYKLAEENTLKDLRLFLRVSYTEILGNMNITRKCFHNLTNQDNSMATAKTQKFTNIDEITIVI